MTGYLEVSRPGTLVELAVTLSGTASAVVDNLTALPAPDGVAPQPGTTRSTPIPGHTWSAWTPRGHWRAGARLAGRLLVTGWAFRAFAADGQLLAESQTL